MVIVRNALAGLKGAMIVSLLPARRHQCPGNNRAEHGAYCHTLLILSAHSHTNPSIMDYDEACFMHLTPGRCGRSAMRNTKKLVKKKKKKKEKKSDSLI